jgi:glycosyltransferase involved in cell wall biosynthesis
MRVLVVLGSSAGGVGRHVQGLVAGLAEAGHVVIVACPSGVEGRFGFADRGARVVAVEIADRPQSRDATALRTLRRLARDADVVHAHGLRAGALTALAMVRADAPLVVTLHNAAPMGRFTAPVYAALERIVARRADLVLGVSADLVERAEALGARRAALAVVAAPAPPRAFRDREALRQSLGVSAGTRVIVTAARLAPQKDLPVLLDAIAGLGLDEVVLLIAGDGPMRAELAARIRRDALPVRLLGHRSDVPDLLAAADIVASAARWEGQPVWLQEALFAGAAIVATDAGGTAAVLGDAALLVPVGDAPALTAALRHVLEDPAARDALREAARSRAAELPTGADALAAALTAYDSVRTPSS